MIPQLRNMPPRARIRVRSAAVVGSNDILSQARQMAASCAPDFVRNQRNSACGAPPACNQYTPRSQSKTTAAAANATVSFTFQRPFQLAKLSIDSQLADGVTITSAKLAGVELLVDGPVNGGIFSTGNQESGGPLGNGDWVAPGQEIVLTVTQAASATTYTIGGVGS